MFLHTKLSSTECMQRLSQPYLSDPYAPNTAGTIKPKNKQMGKLGYRKWVILVNSCVNGYEVQERSWLESEQDEFQMEKSNVQASFRLSLKDNPSGGTDIEYKEVRSIKKILMAGFLPILLGFLFMAMRDNPQYRHLVEFPGSFSIMGMIMFIPMIVAQLFAQKVVALQNILSFTSKLLEAKEIMFYKDTQISHFMDQNKPTLQQQISSLIAEQLRNTLHTGKSVDECVRILSQPFLSDPDSADTENIIKRPTIPQVYYDERSKRATVVNVNGNDFEVQSRYWSIYGKKEFPIADSKVAFSQKCSLSVNPNGGTDIKYDQTKIIRQILTSAAVLILFLMFRSTIVPIQNSQHNVIFLYIHLMGPMLLFILLAFLVAKFYYIKKLIKFVADLLDAG